ncbi:serine hydrolase [Cupriavidus sp. AU9028]|uniref:serine hydrolase n=1 Tax=Cupriavidus sp. AU9028 TaxID=2871157 RepID=UPI001C961A24|nr:serine hydrolase [Cupriavidus sp. AU9028]MBY4899237.1 beta-lactamase [Cupriavidus sp. AU9028]
MRTPSLSLILACCTATLLPPAAAAVPAIPSAAAEAPALLPRDAARVRQIVDAAIGPAMAREGIPGMAVGVTIDGRQAVFLYGVASRKDKQPVTERTLFEVGSISKTFAATVAAYADVTGAMSLSDPLSAYLPSLQGTPAGAATVLQLGTQTSGLPFSAPPGVTDSKALVRYLAALAPARPPGSLRIYSNAGIGLLGDIVAARMGMPYDKLVKAVVLDPLALLDTLLEVPKERMRDYAQGYTATDAPARLRPGLLWQPAYGVRATAGDMLRFAEANLSASHANPAEPGPLARALAQTHRLRVRAGPVRQALVWERYPWPAPLASLQQASDAALEHLPAQTFPAGSRDEDNVLIHKTGGTNGFSAYLGFLPARRIGLVLLANKAYPPQQRMVLAHTILTALDKTQSR